MVTKSTRKQLVKLIRNSNNSNETLFIDIVDDRQDGTVRVGSGDFNGRGRGSKCIGFLGFLHISEPNPHNSTETELHSSASSSSPSPMPVLSFPPSSSSSSSFSPRLVSASSTFNRKNESSNNYSELTQHFS